MSLSKPHLDKAKAVGIRTVVRRAHTRRGKSGQTVIVRECVVSYETDSGTEAKSSYRRPCPKCGADIISTHMPNGGWVHYFGAAGLTRIKHPCMHPGAGLS